ncbi:hypothetical protein ACQ4PT_063312 [Festuca glaucescens]
MVRPGPARSRTVQQGLQGNAWVRDIAGVLSVDAVVQFLRLWPLIQSVQGRCWCWTADRLQRRGLPNHGLCPLCQLVGEDIDHLLVQCPFLRAIWFNLFRPRGFLQLLPATTDRLSDWWPPSTAAVAAASRRSFNSLCLLILRAIWMERNARVFEDTACLASTLSERVAADWQEWAQCRTRGRFLGE